MCLMDNKKIKMKKIILTERQQKLMEEYQQMESGRNEVLHFNTDVDWTIIGDIIGVSDNWVIDSDSKFNIDWVANLKTSDAGYVISHKINYVYGKLLLKDYDTDEIKSVNIDKSWAFTSNVSNDNPFNVKDIVVTVDLKQRKVSYEGI